ncbi:MAG: GNAT family N-acetyltransferase [Sphingobacteriales bacterium]|nr:GNAT family N-acetyltransferase [Sphingobacteriales bacterium]
MNKVIVTENFDPLFWKSYSALWCNSTSRSPYQSPAILQYFTSYYKGHIISILLKKENKLYGAVILKESEGVYTFLSDLKTDVNFFTFHQSCTDDDLEFFFSGFLQIIRRKNWSVMLNNVPSWADYFPSLSKIVSKSNLFCQNISYSVSPLMEAENPAALIGFLDNSFKFRRLRSRLLNHLNGDFEILTDDTDLEEWTTEFCQTHIKKWGETSTRSSFLKKGRQQFLLDSMKAWCNDKVLTRFAIKSNGKRIAFSISLKSPESLIGHSTTYDPDYHKYSPGKVLLQPILKWSADNQFSKFDFGDGDENYKFQFATKNQVMNRIMISPKTNIAFILKTLLIKTVRNNRQAYEFYRKKIKNLIRFSL